MNPRNRLPLQLLCGSFELRRALHPGEEDSPGLSPWSSDLEHGIREAARWNTMAAMDLLEEIGELSPGLFSERDLIFSRLMEAVRWRRLVVAAPGVSASDDPTDRSWDAYDAFIAQAGRTFVVAGRSHRLVSRGLADDLRKKADHDVVPVAEAKALVKHQAHVARASLPPAQLELLLQHIVDLRVSTQPHGFVLLREPLERAERAISPKEVITPAKMKGLAGERLKDPRWLAEEPRGTRETLARTASIDDQVFVRVTTSKFPKGTSVTFVLMDAANRDVVATLIGTVGDGETEEMAHAAWIIPEALESGPVVPDRTEFLVSAEVHGQRCDGGIVKVVPAIWEILIQIDAEDPEALDDELILYDTQGSEVERVGQSDMAKEGEDWVRVKFKNTRRLRRYTLVRDHGPDEGGGVDVLFENMSPDELEALTEQAG